MTLVTNTWSFQTTGELQPVPGTSALHRTFSVELHVSGSLGSSAATPARGPLNWVHWSWAASEADARAAASESRRRRGTVRPKRR
jgi:hypothetical protein